MILAIIFRKKLFRMGIQREYLSRNHSKFLLKYHIILVCKYRRKALVGDVGFAMKHILLDIAQESDFDIEVMETDKDHVHLLVSAPPKLSPLQIVRRLKQDSSHRIWQRHADTLRRIYWGCHDIFWTKGYFVSSIGNVSQETIKHYIENQG